MMRPDAPWAKILIVDDQAPNVILLERMLEQWGYDKVTVTTQSHEVPNLVAQLDPDLLLLDLQMPKPDGFELMEILGPRIEAAPRMPALVLTADATTATRQRALSVGASDFLSKPLDPVEVRLRIANLLETRRLELEMLGQNQVLEQRVRERTVDLENARLELLERLALAAEYRDDNTQEHAQRVGRTAALLGSAMGMATADIEVLLRAAPLHDIGKVGVPDAILLKSAPLSIEEFAVMRAHTTIGAQILSGSEFAILQTAEQIAAHHHERFDGSGYPRGLAGDAIPLAGRVVAVADVFDALVHERPYKPAWPLEQAIEEIVALGGTHFDPDIVAAFETLDHAHLLHPIAASAPEPEAWAGVVIQSSRASSSSS
jgi:putative two-component system response regulator